MIWYFKHRKVFALIVLGICVHAIILSATLDIYFSSPIDQGMVSIKSTDHPPAKRVVLIVADGLRAESLFDSSKWVAPNLNKIRNTRGSGGISFSRVPTESRPGHVALLGGIYEDPAAILKGWKANPVDFDSVINQSRNAWCWGGPSIINMFNKDNLSHIHLSSYDPYMEDFGKNNSVWLDKWVFDKVEAFLEEKSACTDCNEFREEGNLFFLHLLGMDTVGHAFKPGSKEYHANLRFVDSNIPKIERLFEAAFPDNSTAFIFTADHGMSNWGSHGAGSDHEIQTPLIAWGAGIKNEPKTKYVRQINIAPLISALIGINYPINSLGQLPHEYLDVDDGVLREMLTSNIIQLLEIFNVKRYRRMNSSIAFVAFQDIQTLDLQARLYHLEHEEDIYAFKMESEKFMTFLIEGADYYHNYYQLPLLIAVTIGLVAWIIYLGTYTIQINENALQRARKRMAFLEVMIMGPVYIDIIYILKKLVLPWTYYFYFMFPAVMVHIVVRRYPFLVKGLKMMKRYGFLLSMSDFATYVVGLRLLVQGFIVRPSISVVMWILALCVMFWKTLKDKTRFKTKVLWLCSCFLLSMFLYLPVMQTSYKVSTYLFGCCAWWILYDGFIINHIDYAANQVVYVQNGLLKLTPLYSVAIEYGVITADSPIKYLAWIWAFAPIFAIPYSTTHLFSRLTSIFLGFTTFYFMVTTNYEPFFLLVYVFALYTWLTMEGYVVEVTGLDDVKFNDDIIVDRTTTAEDYRRAFFLVAFIFLGFFGTGNITSLNSFDPLWVRCFVTVFSPFKMTALILLRTMVPFIFVTCTYRAINVIRKADTLNMFCIVLLFSDIMLLELLYYITNIGSWLEIGTSLSQFIIMEAFVIILLLLYGLASLLTTTVYHREPNELGL